MILAGRIEIVTENKFIVISIENNFNFARAARKKILGANFKLKLILQLTKNNFNIEIVLKCEHHNFDDI